MENLRELIQDLTSVPHIGFYRADLDHSDDEKCIATFRLSEFPQVPVQGDLITCSGDMFDDDGGVFVVELRTWVVNKSRCPLLIIHLIPQTRQIDEIR